MVADWTSFFNPFRRQPVLPGRNKQANKVDK